MREFVLLTDSCCDLDAQMAEDLGLVVIPLSVMQEGKEYIIQDIVTDDEDMDAFLFSLGCYSGESITVVSRKKNSCVVSIKDGRYNIDNQLAEAIVV